MDANAYQKAVNRTMNAATPDLNRWQMELLNWSMGLAGECGEFVDAVKKMVFHGHVMERHHLIEELGDVLWYVTSLATQLNVPMDEVMAINVAKLVHRYPHGFDQDRSAKRDD